MDGKTRSAVGLAAVAVLAVGCSRSIETSGLERALAGDLADEFDTAYTVNCPHEMTEEDGDDILCSARGEDGTELMLQITQTDEDASVTYEIVEG
jgi:hypothetical protein